MLSMRTMCARDITWPLSLVELRSSNAMSGSFAEGTGADKCADMANESGCLAGEDDAKGVGWESYTGRGTDEAYRAKFRPRSALTGVLVGLAGVAVVAAGANNNGDVSDPDEDDAADSEGDAYDVGLIMATRIGEGVSGKGVGPGWLCCAISNCFTLAFNCMFSVWHTQTCTCEHVKTLCESACNTMRFVTLEHMSINQAISRQCAPGPHPAVRP